MNDAPKHLTTRQGHPVVDNQSQRTVGDRGPAPLENYQFLEQVSHFARERVPPPLVHARGSVAPGSRPAYGRLLAAPPPTSSSGAGTSPSQARSRRPW